MLEYFDQARSAVRGRIKETLEGGAARWDRAAPGLGTDAARRLEDFALRGKMIRGVLVRLGYELASGKTAEGSALEAVERAGAAMELFQSGLLVHDDIMDRDRTRRGVPTIHVEYERALGEAGYGDPVHYGEALGVCAGDLAYFAGFGVLASLPVVPEAARKAAEIAAGELCLVGAAQMLDVANGAARPGARNAFAPGPAEPDEEGILRLYRYKTGRYTFSLPLALGAAIAGSGDATRAALEASGEELGLLFQLKDDELGVYADEAELGKPLGSDLREDKKTLFRLLLLRAAEGETAARLEAIFGDPRAGAAELAAVRAAAETLGVKAEHDARMKAYAEGALAGLGGILAKAPEAAARAFRELVAYSLERTS